MMKEGVLLILVLSCIMKCSNCCFRNFPKLSEVQSATDTIDTVSNEVSRRYIFPELQITCDTKIYRIIYKIDPTHSPSLDLDLLPVIQLLRPSSLGYNPIRTIEFYSLQSVNMGEGSTIILTLRQPIDLNDDSGVHVLGVFLPAGSSFHFERKPNATPAYYVETNLKFNSLSTESMTRQDSVLPLITMITDLDSVPTISSISISTSSSISTSTSSSISTSTSSSISTTSGSISITRSSSLQTVRSTATVTTNHWSSTAVNTPMTTGSGELEGSARMYRIIIIPIVSVLVFGLVTGFIVVTCVLTYKLNKAKANNQLASRDTFNLSSDGLSYSSGFSRTYDKTKHQRQELNSMIINESYERIATTPHRYSILNLAKQDLESSNSTTCSGLDTEQYCETNPSYVPSNPLPTCPLTNQERLSTCHLYEDPNMFLSPNNYECPQDLSSIEIPNYKEDTII